MHFRWVFCFYIACNCTIKCTEKYGYFALIQHFPLVEFWIENGAIQIASALNARGYSVETTGNSIKNISHNFKINSPTCWHRKEFQKLIEINSFQSASAYSQLKCLSLRSALPTPKTPSKVLKHSLDPINKIQSETILRDVWTGSSITGSIRGLREANDLQSIFLPG